MPGGGIADAEATNISQCSRRTTDDDRIDLDYDEDALNESCEDIKSIGSKSPSQSAILEDEDIKEEGELEDGEISDSEEETPVKSKEDFKTPEKKPITVRLSYPGRTKSGKIASAELPTQPKKSDKTPAKDSESPWEKGLREAREAMRRASKTREDPDYESKRLLAAPALRRSSRTDSDHSSSPYPRRKNTSRSKSPRSIPSLLDIRTSTPPRRIPPKDAMSFFSRRTLRPIRRRSPSYTSFSRSRSISPWRFDLGPQVIYPNGRPCPKREPERDRRDRDRRRTPSPPRRGQDTIKNRDSHGDKSSKSKNETKKKIEQAASPISSDSDSGKTKKKSTKAEQNGVNDPWARKKTRKDKKRRSRSSSSDASSDSSRSTFTGRRKYRSTSNSFSDSDSEDDRKKKTQKKSSSKSGKKHRNKEKNPVEEFFSKKKSDLPAAFRKRSRRRSSSSDSDDDNGGIKDISSSDSDASSNSTKSSKYSHISAKMPTKILKRGKSPSPISDNSSNSPSPPPPPAKRLEEISPPNSPPKKKSKDSNEPVGDDIRSKRKNKLLKQLREVEEELEKHRVVRMGTAH